MQENQDSKGIIKHIFVLEVFGSEAMDSYVGLVIIKISNVAFHLSRVLKI